jgi:DNA-binding PadR family transcriptional regulator
MGSEPILLGEFEQMVLLAVLQAERTEAGAYGITVFDELSTRTKRYVLRGAVYMTLDRLEKKGLLTSFLTEPTAARGGRARRCYRVTKTARVALRASQRALMNLWAGLDLATEKK